jgi:uncharacterized protein YcfL
MRPTSALVACVLLALTGCGGSDTASGDDEAMIDWDLSQSHTMDDVDWPKPDLSAVEISPVEEVRIALPDGRSFESDGDTVHDITLDRRDRTVRNVQIDSHPRSEADAHELAVRWAEEWDLSPEPLDRWRDGATKTPAITSGRPVERIGDGGPVPIVEIRNSFQDENPVLVSLQFYWPD